MKRDSLKVNVFCVVSRRCVFGPFFCMEDSVTGMVYLDMLENWLMPQLTDEEKQEFIYQQDGAPSHWHLSIQEYLNRCLPSRWTGRVAATDIFCTWPLWSLDPTACDFFLWSFIRDIVYTLPLPKTLPVLQRCINTAICHTRHVQEDLARMPVLPEHLPCHM